MDQDTPLKFDPDMLPRDLIFIDELPVRRAAYDKLKDLVIRKSRERPAGTVHFLQCPGCPTEALPIHETDKRITLIYKP